MNKLRHKGKLMPPTEKWAMSNGGPDPYSRKEVMDSKTDYFKPIKITNSFGYGIEIKITISNLNKDKNQNGY